MLSKSANSPSSDRAQGNCDILSAIERSFPPLPAQFNKASMPVDLVDGAAAELLGITCSGKWSDRSVMIASGMIVRAMHRLSLDGHWSTYAPYPALSRLQHAVDHARQFVHCGLPAHFLNCMADTARSGLRMRS